MSLIGSIFNHVLPPKCPLSGEVVESQGMLSPAAWRSLTFIADPICHCCGIPLEVVIEDGTVLECGACIAQPKIFYKARSVLVYDDNSRNLILAFKHGDQTHMVLTFVPWLKRAGAEILQDADLILPVPLHWTRLLKRRYNQAALIAMRLSKETGIMYAPDYLKRARATPTQGYLSAKERQKNVQNAFEISDKNKDKIRNKKIVLIDDVYTTGATVEECAETLYAAGAARVDVLTVARVSKSGSIS